MQIYEPAKYVNVIESVDMCIVGGSCTGVFAAVRAARMGIKTAIIEKASYFGGACTKSGINVWHSTFDYDFKEEIIGGLTKEIIVKLEKQQALIKRPKNVGMYLLNTEELKIELDQLLLDAEVSCWLNTMYSSPYMENEEIKGVFVENKDGRGIILASVFVDATGDGDLCRDLQISRYLYDEVMPPSPCFKLHKNNPYPVHISELIERYHREFDLPDDWGWNCEIPYISQHRFLSESHVFSLDCTTAKNITQCELEGRAQVRKIIDLLHQKMPDEDKVRLIQLYELGIRDSFHYECLYKIKTDDILYGKQFKDSILNSSYCIDIHHSDDRGVTIKRLNGTASTYSRCSRKDYTWHTYNGDYPQFWQVPYQAIVSKHYKNLIIVGRMMDAEQHAFSAVRNRVNLNQLAEAAGIAGYLAVKTQTSVAKIDTCSLRTILKKGNSIVK